MIIEIDDIPPSYNQFLGNSKSHFIYSQKKKEWAWKVKLALPKRAKKFKGKVKIEIEYHFGDKRRHDLDNYSGKFLMDALVANGVIKDDSCKVIPELILRGKIGEKKKTIITIKNYKGGKRNG